MQSFSFDLPDVTTSVCNSRFLFLISVSVALINVLDNGTLEGFVMRESVVRLFKTFSGRMGLLEETIVFLILKTYYTLLVLNVKVPMFPLLLRR